MDFRRTFVSALAAVTGLALALVGPASPALAADTTATFAPGSGWNSTSGSALQLHGLGILKVGNTWYGFGEDKTGETSSNTGSAALCQRGKLWSR